MQSKKAEMRHADSLVLALSVITFHYLNLDSVACKQQQLQCSQ